MTTDVSPATTADISDLLARACRDGRTVSIVGGGTKSGWGAIPTPTDITLSTSALNRVLAHRHGDLTATIQAGATLDAVNRELARHRQWLPLDPPWSHRATIGGIVATNDSGPRRHRYGAPRDLIIGVDVIRADGVAAKAGGIVVKNVAGYDLARLMTGSFGTLAAIVSATFKLFPLVSASRTVVIDFSDSAPQPRRSSAAVTSSEGGKASAERSASLLSALVHSQLTPTAIELQTPPLRILVRFETVDVAADDQAAKAARMAEEAGARVSVLRDAEESALWSEHGARPWNGDGAVFKVTLLPSDVAPTVQWLSETLQCLDHDVVGRAGIGVLLVRVGGSDDTQARVLNDLRARLPVGRGSAVVVRASDALRSRVDAWGPLGEGLPLMRAIKQRFDPSGILNPGRLGL